MMRSISYKFSSHHGYPDVTIETSGMEEFGEWLSGDLQGSDIFFQKIEKAIIDIKNGAKMVEEFSGNGILLTLTKEGATVQSILAFDDDPAIENSDYPRSEQIDLDEFAEMARAWFEYRKENF